MKVLVTGAAGFIGFFLVGELLSQGYDVVGLDSINDYYHVSLKFGRLSEHGIQQNKVQYNRLQQSVKFPKYRFVQLKLEDKTSLLALFARENFDFVCNLAAQAGVRYSITNPDAYLNSNIIGFLNILEACRYHNIKHLVNASSSSVYGLNEKMPFATTDNVDHPVSLYAASKKSNELMAHSYSHLYNLPITSLRFFTVYGAWGRPDMALFLFTEAMLNNQVIKVFNNGEMQRDFTYVGDIAEGVSRVMASPPKGDPFWSGLTPNPSSSKAPFKVYNIGNSKPIKLMDFIEAIENKLGITAQKEMLPLQAGDVLITYADTQELENDFGYKPNTPLAKGVGEFVDWYRDFYKK